MTEERKEHVAAQSECTAPTPALPSAVQPHWGRRAFLGTAAAALAAALTAERQPLWEAGEPPAGVWRPLLRSAELVAGQARHVRVEDRTLLLVRLADGALRAFDARCPHLGCPVLWSKEHQQIDCPCHGAAFDPEDGTVRKGPPPRGLQPLAVREQGGMLFVQV